MSSIRCSTIKSVEQKAYELKGGDGAKLVTRPRQSAATRKTDVGNETDVEYIPKPPIAFCALS